MDKKRKKNFFKAFLILILLIVGTFSLNWYMTHRLESYLKRMLSEKVLEATDGLYDLSFDTLSIGLFNGELLMSGIELKPDSTTFQTLLAKDSLPKTYLKLKINSIYFQGLNLTWRWSYKKLNFNLFEIQQAEVEVYESPIAQQEIEQTKQESKTLYEMINPFINVLQVKEINLKNMSISYITNDGATPSHYGLQNVSFHAYNFTVDEDSYTSGKLLYSDNFNFITNQPQEILSNSQFSLKTNNIELNTADSIIQIDGIDLVPQKSLWKQVNQIPDSYLEAQIKTIALKGIKFSRENALNYLLARSFEIGTSDLKYFTTKADSSNVTSKTDTLDLSWSLYSIISPILHEVSIKDIMLKDAKFKYSESFKNDSNIYTLNKLELIANNFLVDSLTDIDPTRRFLHSENFALKASGINGLTPEKNYKFGIDQMIINTATRNFNIANVTLGPIKTSTTHDYILGNVQEINIDSLYYNNGIEASRLTINSPVVEYVKVEGITKVRPSRGNKAHDDSTRVSYNAWNQLIPFLDHLLVRNINLTNGNIAYRDIITKNRYNLNQLNFYAKNIKIDQKAIDNLDNFLVSNDFGFNFQNFNSEIESYKLKIQKASFDIKDGIFSLKNVDLTPLPNIKNKNLISLNVPTFDIKGFRYMINKNNRGLNVKSFDLISPKISITKNEFKQPADKPKPKVENKNSLESVFRYFRLEKLNLVNADVKFIDNTTRDSLHSSIKQMLVKNINWNTNKKTSIDEVLLDMPHIYMVKHDSVKKKNEQNSDTSPHPLFVENLNIRKFRLLNLTTQIKQPYLNLSINTNNLDFTDLKWNKDLFSLGSVLLQSPKIDIIQSTKEQQSDVKKTSSKKNIYETLGAFSKKINIKNFSVVEASINYNHPMNDVPAKIQKLNNTNLNMEGLRVDNTNKSFTLDDITFNTKDIRLPINDGFYTIQVDSIGLSKQKAELSLNKIALIPAYPKLEFAYRNPQHKDWFDVTVDNVTLSGIDIPTYFSDKILNAERLQVSDVVLQNFKTQKIEITHNVMPMIYEGLQNLPLKLSIKNTDVRNFNVYYEELPKKGEIPAKIFLTGMNGHLKELTNIVTEPDQFIELNADGNFMGTGYFTAQWMIPVDKKNDCFLLKGHLHEFDLTELNQLITPMAPAEIKSGLVKDTKFNIQASSINANVNMLMLYNNLQLSVFKNDDPDSPNKFLTRVVNTVLRKNNPNKPNKKPRESHAFIVRDPYHSTFNYFWQILQPPLVESVGISQGKQTFMKKVTGAISRVKDFFKGRKDKRKEKKKEQEEKDTISNLIPISDNQ